MNKEDILSLFREIKHPEAGDIVSAGIVSTLAVSEEGISITLKFARPHDPFANSLKRQMTAAITKRYPAMEGKVSIDVDEPAKPVEIPSSTEKVKYIIAVSSGKGGVGKSTVATNIAVSLSQMGYDVGILDADIYGPSLPKMFGVEDYQPLALKRDNVEYIVPAEKWNIKIASIGFFINPDDALMWRGPMAHSALKQLIHQTMWEKLDFLLIDMPPGTGDVHLSIINELKLSGAVVVTTPQQVAVADAVRGIRMFQTPQIDIPVLGVVENMSWFTPEELPKNRYYVFGKGGGMECASRTGVDFLGQIPVIESIAESSDSGMPIVLYNDTIKEFYENICRKIVEKVSK